MFFKPNLNGRQEEQSSGRIFDNQISLRWLSTAEAACYLGITPNALRILVHRGRVIAYKLGNKLRFQVTDLRLTIKKKEVNLCQ